MKIELKRLSISERLSQETTAFAADVWVDGKNVGTAENDGRGGETIVRVDPSVRAAVEAHGSAIIPAEYARVASGTVWVVDQLVSAELTKRDDAKFARKLAKGDVTFTKKVLVAGYHAARARLGNAWTWFAFSAGEDPKVVATTLATKHKKVVDELVVLS